MRALTLCKTFFSLGIMLGNQALAETAVSTDTGSATAVREARWFSRFGKDRFGVEVKPLPVVASSNAGIGSNSIGALGAGIEWLTGPNLAMHADGYRIDSGIINYDEGNRESGLYPYKITGYSAELGGRYYGEHNVSSWYAGAKIGLLELESQYKFKDDALVKSTNTSLTPGLEGGYRWLIGWQKDFTVRLGVVAAANTVQTRTRDLGDLMGTNDEQDAREELDDRIEVPVFANLDLGVGYLF